MADVYLDLEIRSPSCFMFVFPVRCDERSLLNGFNHDRDALTTADARGAQAVALSSSTQCMQ